MTFDFFLHKSIYLNLINTVTMEEMNYYLRLNTKIRLTGFDNMRDNIALFLDSLFLQGKFIMIKIIIYKHFHKLIKLLLSLKQRSHSL